MVVMNLMTARSTFTILLDFLDSVRDGFALLGFHECVLVLGVVFHVHLDKCKVQVQVVQVQEQVQVQLLQVLV